MIMARLFRFLVTIALCFNFRVTSTSHGNNGDYNPGATSFNVTTNGNDCVVLVHQHNPFIHKTVYRVGYLAREGVELAMSLYGKTFGEYLSATAGKHFDPPVLFEFVPVAIQSTFMRMIEAQEIDIVFAPVSFVSCLSTSYDAEALLTIVRRTKSRGVEYELDVFAGVMFVHKDRHDIETVQDFDGKIVAVDAIDSWGGGQSQLFEIEKQGVSPTANLKQVVITGNATSVIGGVLDGTFDVGFVTAGQIERYKDVNGTLLNLGKC